MSATADAPPRPAGPGAAAADSAPRSVQLSAADRVSAAAWPAVAVLAAALVLAPVAFLAGGLLDPAVEVWQQQWRTRLPGELLQTAGLLVGVGVGTVLLGGALAWLVSAYRFPGSRILAWALVAPLAVPGYVLGFVVLSVAGYTGPIQGSWRAAFGQTARFADVESLGGAIVVFTLVLYPYVYLLARAALADQAGTANDVARSLGAGPVEAMRRVTGPLLRPAIAAGAGLVMMETLTDYATVQYFGVDTVSVGLFRIWRGTFDRDAAAEFAILLLVVALLVVAVERALRGRARFGQAGGAGAGMTPRRLTGWRGALATVTCLAVLVPAFLAPVTQLGVWAVAEAAGPRGTPLVSRFGGYLANSLVLAVTAAVACVVVAVLLANAQRFSSWRPGALAVRAATAGYGLPGPVLAIGVVLALVALDAALGLLGWGLPGAVATGSFVGLVYAYTIRFLAPALGAVEAGIGQVPDEVTASARSLGRRPAGVLAAVHLPLARTSVLTAAVIVGIDAIKELPIVLLLRPFGFDTLSVWTYNLASESRFQQAALPALAIVAVALVPVLALAGYHRRLGSRP